MRDDYTRSATVLRVIDGDTIKVSLSLGWDIYTQVSVRFAGINARELHDDGGPEARDHLTKLLPAGTPVTIQSLSRDKYGRALAVVVLGKQNLNQRLLNEGWAAPYTGEGKTSEHVPVWPRAGS